MKRKAKPMDRYQDNFEKEIFVDLFCGGGGASMGIEEATGIPVFAAVNHDPDAIAQHIANHRYTEHYQTSIWEVDPRTACKGRPVGLAWFSPDCTHFSKARGGKPVKKEIRSLSWIVLKWALDVHPRVLMMENVEEIQSWGPLMKVIIKGEEKWVPDPDRAGETFQAFIGALTTGIPADHPAIEEICEYLRLERNSPELQKIINGLGYDVEYRELVAAKFGAPTTRKRFALVGRCDGRPIVWPNPTHAPRNSAEVKAGKLKPWRSAAEIIDWALPSYSIFDTKEQIKEKYGVNAIRPLADNTMKRVICGVDKHSIKSANPFLVECNHGGDGHTRSVEEPLNTVTGKYTGGVAQPIMEPFTFSNTGGSVGSPACDPVHTIRSAGGQVLASASLMCIGQTGGGDRIRDVREPVPTVVSKQEACLLSANLIQYHTEQTENARTADLSNPLNTVDASNRYGLATAQLVEYYGNGQAVGVGDPLHTVTSHDRNALTMAHIQKFYGGVIGSECYDPLPTVTAIDHNALCAAHIVKFKHDEVGTSPEDPLPTITAQSCAGGYAECRAVLAKVGGTQSLGHWPKIRELLNKYCGYHMAEDEIILLIIHGIAYFIADILLRMLTPRELYNAMGFPPDYIIDVDHLGRPYPKSKQVARCGNAVCPPMARAMVQANLPEYCIGIDIKTLAQFHKTVAV